MENTNKMVSLFDFLGKPSGPEKGRQVAIVAKRKKIATADREVNTLSYTGKVSLYPESFLKEYFSEEYKSVV